MHMDLPTTVRYACTVREVVFTGERVLSLRPRFVATERLMVQQQPVAFAAVIRTR